MDKYPSDNQVEITLEYINLVFFAIFLIEMILKLYVYGFKVYGQSNFNLFDAFVIIISTIDIIVSFLVTSYDQEAAGAAVSVFRTFRLLRVFKLA